MKEDLLLLNNFNRTLKNKIYKYITLLSKNVFIDKLANIVNKYNNTYNSTIKMKPDDIKLSKYLNFGTKNNEKDSKFKVGDYVRISNNKIIFAKDYGPNWSEKGFMIKTVKVHRREHLLLVILTA